MNCMLLTRRVFLGIRTKWYAIFCRGQAKTKTPKTLVFRESNDIGNVQCLQFYLNLTASQRENREQKFHLCLSFVPHRHVVKGCSIARWLKVVVQEVGINMSKSKPYSTRSAAVSDSFFYGEKNFCGTSTNSQDSGQSRDLDRSNDWELLVMAKYLFSFFTRIFFSFYYPSFLEGNVFVKSVNLPHKSTN